MVTDTLRLCSLFVLSPEVEIQILAACAIATLVFDLVEELSELELQSHASKLQFLAQWHISKQMLRQGREGSPGHEVDSI